MAEETVIAYISVSEVGQDLAPKETETENKEQKNGQEQPLALDGGEVAVTTGNPDKMLGTTKEDTAVEPVSPAASPPRVPPVLAPAPTPWAPLLNLPTYQPPTDANNISLDKAKDARPEVRINDRHTNYFPSVYSQVELSRPVIFAERPAPIENSSTQIISLPVCSSEESITSQLEEVQDLSKDSKTAPESVSVLVKTTSQFSGSETTTEITEGLQQEKGKESEETERENEDVMEASEKQETGKNLVEDGDPVNNENDAHAEQVDGEINNTEKLGHILVDFAKELFEKENDAETVVIQGYVNFSIANTRGRKAVVRIQKRIPLAEIQTGSFLDAESGISLDIQRPPAMYRERNGGTTMLNKDAYGNDNPHTRKRGRPKGWGRVKKLTTSDDYRPLPKRRSKRSDIKVEPPDGELSNENSGLADDANFKFTCVHCSFSTSSDAVYNNHVRKCEEMAQSNEFQQPGANEGKHLEEEPVEYEEDLESEPDAAMMDDNNDDDYLPPEDVQADIEESMLAVKEEPRTRKGRKPRRRGAGVIDGDGWTRKGKIYHCKSCEYTTDHSVHIREHVSRHSGVKPFQCELCDKAFIKSVDLKRHKQSHERTFECKECSIEFDNKPEMTAHFRTVHKKKAKDVYQICKLCKKQCVSKEDLAQHMQQNHEHICSICGEQFRTTSMLRKHRNQAHAGEAIMCNVCNKTFQTQSGYQRHVQTHTGERIPCDICGKLFTTRSSLSHHKRALHAGVKKYKCDKCGKEFNFYHSLKLHLLQHEGSRPYKCDVCGKSYLTANHLKNHKEGVHAVEKKYKCPVCNKAFPYDNSLKLHMILHTGDRPYQCEVCGKGFVSKGALKSHQASHQEGRNFVCKECGKTFKAENLLRAHWRRHTEDGSRFMCDICGLTFMYRSNLEQHSAVHGDERKYTCNQCDKSFKTMATLYSHRLVHTETTPFHCSVCGKGFKSKDRVIAHEKRHSGLKPFQCSLCGNSFPDKGGLSKHMKTVHAKTKKFMCPVCGKQSNRMDNLRVHMKTHGERGGLQAVNLDDRTESNNIVGEAMRQENIIPPDEAAAQIQEEPQAPPPMALPLEQVRSVSASPHMNHGTPTPTPPGHRMTLAQPAMLGTDLRMAVEMAQQQHGQAMHPSMAGLPASHMSTAISMIQGAQGLLEAGMQPGVTQLQPYSMPQAQSMSSTVDTTGLHMTTAHTHTQLQHHHPHLPPDWKPTWQ